MPDRMQGMLSIVFVEFASSGQLVRETGFFFEWNVRFRSGEEDGAGTTIYGGEVRPCSFIDLLGQLLAHLDRRDQARREDVSVH